MGSPKESGKLLQPYFEGNVRMKLTLPKLGLGSPPGFLKLQSSIVKVKTPHIGTLFISFERTKSIIFFEFVSFSY
jgi:hypothetical protein